jgi:hypothetical protein
LLDLWIGVRKLNVLSAIYRSTHPFIYQSIHLRLAALAFTPGLEFGPD